MEVLDTDSLCPFCGKRLMGAALTPARRRTRIAAVLAAIFIGLPTAAVGVCSVVTMGGPGYKEYGIINWIVGGFSFLILALVIWSTVTAWRK
jgi:hypothetical protein